MVKQVSDEVYETINMSQEVGKDDETDDELKEFNVKDSFKIHSKSLAKKTKERVGEITANESKQIGKNEPAYTEVLNYFRYKLK